MAKPILNDSQAHHIAQAIYLYMEIEGLSASGIISLFRGLTEQCVHDKFDAIDFDMRSALARLNQGSEVPAI